MYKSNACAWKIDKIISCGQNYYIMLHPTNSKSSKQIQKLGTNLEINTITGWNQTQIQYKKKLIFQQEKCSADDKQVTKKYLISRKVENAGSY